MELDSPPSLKLELVAREDGRRLDSPSSLKVWLGAWDRDRGLDFFLSVWTWEVDKGVNCASSLRIQLVAGEMDNELKSSFSFIPRIDAE